MMTDGESAYVYNKRSFDDSMQEAQAAVVRKLVEEPRDLSKIVGDHVSQVASGGELKEQKDLLKTVAELVQKAPEQVSEKDVKQVVAEQVAKISGRQPTETQNTADADLKKIVVEQMVKVGGEQTKQENKVEPQKDELSQDPLEAHIQKQLREALKAVREYHPRAGEPRLPERRGPAQPPFPFPQGPFPKIPEGMWLNQISLIYLLAKDPI